MLENTKNRIMENIYICYAHDTAECISHIE